MARKRHKMLGKVDLLGLNQFGDPVGMSPLYGALIGGGAAGVASIIASQASNGQYADSRELIGLTAGLATSGVMYAMKHTRHAALGGVIGAFLSAGLAYVEKTFFGTVTAPAPVVAAGAAAMAAGATPSTGTMGARLGQPRIQYLNGLGIPQIQALNGQGHLGMATISPTIAPVGTIPGVHGPAFAGTQIGSASMRPPVNLLGPASPQSQKIQLMGGPAIHGLSANYGATLLGGGR